MMEEAEALSQKENSTWAQCRIILVQLAAVVESGAEKSEAALMCDVDSVAECSRNAR